MRRIIFLITLITSLFIINNFIHSIYTLWNKQDLLVKAEKDLEAKKKENDELKKRLTLVQSQQFIEEEARNKLFLVKPGESQVIIPGEILKASESAKQKIEDNRPNWQKWWNFFF